ncbi:MAG TPA: PadR family transcriptional regulator [Candidatus Thermoplasmatota archaeon]|nr:PadR family transcriptional regulator [Candidatus Thermoplasmatota archaeon]
MVELSDVARFRDKMDRELKSGLVTLVLLLAIDRTGPDYGYRLLKTIQERSGGRLQFKEGTAYPLLQNLEKMGLITSFWSDGAGGPPRKYYQITDTGRRALDQALTDWRELTDGVHTTITSMDRKANPP